MRFHLYRRFVASVLVAATALVPVLGVPEPVRAGWYDCETGIYYNRARYYHPNLGRFLERDPKEQALVLFRALAMNAEARAALAVFDPAGQFVDGANLYQFVRSNPGRHTDPSGQSLLDFVWSTSIRLEMVAARFAAAHPVAMRFVGGLLAAANLYAFAKYQEVQAIVLAQPNPMGLLAGEAAAIRLAVRDLTSTAGSITALARANAVTRAAATTANAVVTGEFASATGELHHAISRPIWRALQNHRILVGRYVARDARFVARAADDLAHRGYQQWHRQIDDEVIQWLRGHADATADEFEAFLRGIYNRPEMRERFPRGLE